MGPCDRYSWTQPLCDACWPEWTGSNAVEPVRAPGDDEVCCHCGRETSSGIYVRVDPEGAFCAHPTL